MLYIPLQPLFVLEKPKMLDKQLLKDIKKAAYKEGQFTTRAGKQTNYYIDKYLFTCLPDLLDKIVDGLIQIAPAKDSYDRIMAPAMGAVTIASIFAIRVSKPFVIYQNSSEGETLFGPVNKQDRLLVIEDVLTTGSTVLDLHRYVSSLDLNISHIISVIDREEGAKEALELKGLSYSSFIPASLFKTV